MLGSCTNYWYHHNIYMERIPILPDKTVEEIPKEKLTCCGWMLYAHRNSPIDILNYVNFLLTIVTIFYHNTYSHGDINYALNITLVWGFVCIIGIAGITRFIKKRPVYYDDAYRFLVYLYCCIITGILIGFVTTCYTHAAGERCKMMEILASDYKKKKWW